jgi:hypothetical protein
MNSKKNINSFAVSLTGLVLLLSAGCGSNNAGTTTSSQPQNQAAPTYSYTLSETLSNGGTCTYQSPTYSTIEEYCSALEDSNLNQGCALQEREQYFQENCSGNFNPGNGGGGHPPQPEPPRPQPQPQPEPPRPQPPNRDTCTVRNVMDGFGHRSFEVIGQNGQVLGTFPTSESADEFAQNDPRCRR